MNSSDNGRGVFTSNDLRRLFDALEVARPDLSEALNIVRIALGLQPANIARYNGCMVDGQVSR